MQALWMVLAAFFFASMAVCVKIASAWFNSAELVFWRGLLGMLFMWLLARGQGVRLATAYPGMHAWRSLVGVISLGAWFYAIAGLPLATAMTLNYMSSVWIAAFLVGGALLAWNPRSGTAPRQGALALTVLAGFAGVVLMLRPTLGQHQAFAGLVGLLSGLMAAFAYLQVMALGKLGEPEARTVFYFAVGSALAGGIGMAVAGVSPWDWRHALWLLPVGVLASLGQLCMTRAYSHGATLVVANLQYSGIVFGAIYSLLLFGDAIPLVGWLGMALIVGSGIAATVLRERAAPNAPAEEH
ncbi:DMT family transporter [Ramlibacter tataouinensis]|uniref:Candidate transporter n=1 Tax=Ramlibacter tataouinensis (strain ATCC BAA-407 / DSM 14655 / LMG 21543 / TTB310) TaxID=365046 RepID=F5Y2N0_RAMTT|nr:DMT family transporter [Ramlibacter tataouinensis]AEG92393.1 Candidate transporter [Ramlibacter tataouinensis TTB310]